MTGKKTFYISTPIYYPSGKPHIGHAYSTVLADVINRYKKLIGYETFFVTGMDEHGKKIQISAEKNKKEIMQYLNEIADIFKSLWKELKIEYDHFSRTTDNNHIKTVQKIFSNYLSNDLIYLSKWVGLYCVSCEENIALKDTIEKNNELYCVHGHKLSTVEEESYFFKMTHFRNWIADYFKDHNDFIFPISRMNELINNFINNDLTDLSISRSSFNWGIPINENKNHVIYVWMDALFNYLTALNFMNDDDYLYQKYWNHHDAEIVHVLSKEITRFHCIYWPIFLHALNVKLPTKIISHGWILSNGEKMSKSLGNVIDPFYYLNKYGSDAVRYYLIKEISLTNDSIFSNEAFISIYNGDLANNFGNLVSRSIGLAIKYSDGKVKLLNESTTDEFKNIHELIKNFNKQNIEFVNQLTPNKILINVQNIINLANKLIEEKKPWELFKENKIKEINELLVILFKIIELSCFWLSPVLIDGVKQALEQTNITLDFNKIDKIDSVNCVVGKSTPIFVRINKSSEN